MGTGAPVIFVCGTSQSRRLWAPFADRLAATRHVVTYDHRGIGESHRGHGHITVASLADDLSRLISALGYDSIDVLGWSLGSAVAQELAIEHPDQVTSLTLLNTWARTDIYQTAVFSALGQPWRTGDRESALTALGLAFTRAFLNSDAFSAAMAQVEPLFPDSTTAMHAVAEQWWADIQHDTRDRLSTVGAPTLVITADQDLLTPPDLGRDVARLIPSSTLEEFTGPGAGHALVLERPADVAAAVIGFLDHVHDGGRTS
ncbi:alpha/beta hydrolase [Mycobacterium goodii]|nr:alpha/beta hydrolase [Mycolicibacterium goodii]